MAGSTITTVVFPPAAGTTSGAAVPSGRVGSTTPRRGIRGASGGLYVGPVLSYAATEGPASVTHGTGGGGAEDSTAYRESDTYDASGATGEFTGGPSNSVSRPTGRTAYVGTGVQGGSTPGVPFSTTGRAADTGVDRFGRSLTGTAYADGKGAGRYTYTNFDGRSYERVAGTRGGLGNNGRGTTVDGETVTLNTAVPVLSATAELPGQVAIIAGNDKVQVAVDADDITGGANGRRGVIVHLFKRGSDTDEDGAYVGSATAGTVATDGEDDTDLFTGLADSTAYVAYVAFLYDKTGHAGAVAPGPFAARNVVTTT